MITLAFYKGKPSLYDRAVSFFTKGPYSHVEFVDHENGTGWSSSFYEGGVANRRLDWNNGRWDLIQIPGDPHVVRLRMREMLGRRYGVLAQLSFVFPIKLKERKKILCAEAVAVAIGLEDPWGLSPNELYRRVSRLGR